MYNGGLNSWVALITHGQKESTDWVERNLLRRNIQVSTYPPNQIELALKTAQHQNTNLVLISDTLRELKNCYVEPKTGEKGWVTMSVYQAIINMVRRLEYAPQYQMAGLTAQRSLNAYKPDSPILYDRPVWGGFMVIKPTAPELTNVIKSDSGRGVDYSAHNFAQWGGLVHNNDMIPIYDSPPLSDEEKILLKEKWPAYITDNRKVPNGILINFTKEHHEDSHTQPE